MGGAAWRKAVVIVHTCGYCRVHDRDPSLVVDADKPVPAPAPIPDCPDVLEGAALANIDEFSAAADISSVPVA